MINAIHDDGRKAKFSEKSWDLLGKNKGGWRIIDPEPPKEVKDAIKKTDAPAKAKAANNPTKTTEAASPSDPEPPKEERENADLGKGDES